MEHANLGYKIYEWKFFSLEYLPWIMHGGYGFRSNLFSYAH